MLYDVTAMEESFLDYVRHNVTLRSMGERECQWTHDVTGTVTAKVEDPQHEQRGAVASDQMQIRAAESVLASLERYESTPDSAAAKDALRLSGHVLGLLGVPVTTLRDTIDYLRQTKIPALYAFQSNKSRRALLTAQYGDMAPTLATDGVKTLGQQLGNTAFGSDSDEWLADVEEARRLNDPAAEAKALRKLQWWNQTRAADLNQHGTAATPFGDAAVQYAQAASRAEASAAKQRQAAAQTEATDRGRVRGEQLLLALRPWIRRVVHDTLQDLL